MAKLCLKKKSKRIKASLRYKVDKKVREHNRRIKKASKKINKGRKNKIITVPNECPFKSEILKEVEEAKRRKEELKQQQKEIMKAEREAKMKNVNEGKEKHDDHDQEGSSKLQDNTSKDYYSKVYFKEFKKVVQAADIILEVIDARDPMGTRCSEVESAVLQSTVRKRLVIVVNKADLVPRDILEKWLKFLRGSYPTVAFKASTQIQAKRLGRRKMSKNKHKNANIALQVSSCVGAEFLMSLLKNYCRNNNIKTAIRVGVVGLPNVGKSSLINSLKRSRACNVGATPGVTRSLQEVQLDSKIRLIDCPGVVFASNSNLQDSGSIALKNAIKVEQITDYMPAVTAILQRATKQQMMDLYGLPTYETPSEFLTFKAKKQGRFLKGGLLDINGAAKTLIEDWNRGRIRYYTVPPDEDPSTHISSEIAQQFSKEFTLDSYNEMETQVLQNLMDTNSNIKAPFVEIKTEGMIEVQDMQQDDVPVQKGNCVIFDSLSEYKKKKNRRGGKNKKINNKDEGIATKLLTPGLTKRKKELKIAAKKWRKLSSRSERAATLLVSNFENISMT